MFLCINWLDPTIIGGVIGIIGSILGSIIGALSTILLTWLFSRGEVKILALDSECKISEGIKNGIESFRHISENGEHIVEGVKVKFKCLITNGKKENYSFSNLQFVIINRKNGFKKSYELKDTSKKQAFGSLYFYQNAENYLLEAHSNTILDLQFYEVGNQFYSNYQGAKFYIKYVDFKGNNKHKRIYLRFDNAKTVTSI